MTENEKIKYDAITDLFNSGLIHEKIQGICYRHSIPLNADIQSDILQVTFEQLSKYNTTKFVDAYLNNPKRIVALAVKCMLCHGVYFNKKINKSWSHSVARQILHHSTIDHLQHINSIDDYDDDYNIILVEQPNIEFDNDEKNEEQKMWDFIKSELNQTQNDLLNKILQPDYKLKTKEKKEYTNLLPIMKEIILKYKIQN